MPPSTLVLFDIDGTLLRTRGAGREALDEAFDAVCGWRAATEGVYVAGSTDERILRDVAALRGEVWDEARTPALRTAYLAGLARRVVMPARSELCPGVVETLAALRERPHVEVALLTGNWEAGAVIKLAAVGLGDTFAWGAYADDAVERDALVPIARARAAARGRPADRILVIGDTPADVRCARAGDALAVAVETGFATHEAIAAERPDLQVRDLARGLPWLLALV